MNDKHKIVILILALIGNFTFLLTAQTVVVVKDPTTLPSSCFPLKGEDSLETIRNFSTLQESFVLGLIDQEAYNSFSYVYRKAPCAYKSLYQMGPKLISSLIDKSKDPQQKKLLTDTLLMVFASKFNYFGETGLPHKGNWAYHIGKYRAEKNAEALLLYREYFAKGDVSDPYYLKDNLKIAIDQLNKKQYDKAHLISLYLELNSICSNKVATVYDTAALRNWQSTQQQMSKMMRPYLKCTDIDKNISIRLRQSPDNDTIIREALSLYQAAQCGTASATYIQCLEKSYNKNKTYEVAMLLAENQRKKKQFFLAEKYYLQAIELSNSKITKSAILCSAAEMFLNSKASNAYQYTESALALNPNNGRAYYIKGLAIYQQRCGSEIDQAMAACLTVELFNKAMLIDQSLKKEIAPKVTQYKKYFPLKSKAFFYNLKDGDSYTIKCLGQTTTVRTR